MYIYIYIKRNILLNKWFLKLFLFLSNTLNGFQIDSNLATAIT